MGIFVFAFTATGKSNVAKKYKNVIDWYSKLWDEWIDKCEEDKCASKKIKLNSNEYLEDIFPNLKLK